MNEVAFGHEAREKVKAGITIASRAVGSTLGPAGRNVLIEQEGQDPFITNDGVRVAMSIILPDRYQNLGVSLIRQVAEKADEAAGDGTTTATVIAHGILSKGLDLVERGANPIYLREGIERAARDITAKLKEMARPVASLEELVHVANISSEDEEMGRVVAEVVEKIGKDGVVTIEQSPVFGIQKEFVQGMETYGGFTSPFMITDKVKNRAVLEDCHILVTDKFLHEANEVMPLIRYASQNKKKLVIFALSFDYEVLEILMLNQLGHKVDVICVQISEINHELVLSDIAASCGAKVVTKIQGEKLEEQKFDEVLGSATKVIADQEKTTIVAGESPRLEEHIAMLKHQLTEDTEERQTKSLERRIAKLTGGIAVVRIGAASDAELRYMRHKLEDTINATQAAYEEGILPGGGVALVRAVGKHSQIPFKPFLRRLFSTKEQADEAAGYELLCQAALRPIQQIVANCGKQKPRKVLKTIQDTDMPFFGYDARHDQYVNMFSKGIIDPLKVTRSALEKAVSVAALVLTTEVAVVNAKRFEL